MDISIGHIIGFAIGCLLYNIVSYAIKKVIK